MSRYPYSTSRAARYLLVWLCFLAANALHAQTANITFRLADPQKRYVRAFVPGEFNTPFEGRVERRATGERGVDHVGVGDGPGDARLVHQHVDELGLRRELRQEQLDGHLAHEAADAGQAAPVDLGHAAAADALAQHVAVQRLRPRPRLHRRPLLAARDHWSIIPCVA